MNRVVDKFVKELNAQLAEREVTFELSEEAREYLSTKGYDKDNGARPLSRLIQDEVKRPLTEELLFGELEYGGHVLVEMRDGKLHFALKGNPKPGAPPVRLLN
jgi:ATP-dependent Clp protease ATP-binding subunit ClpA